MHYEYYYTRKVFFMDNIILNQLGNIDSEILKCCQLLQILCIYLEETGIDNEECSVASSLAEIIRLSLEENQENYTNILSGIRFSNKH